MLDVIPWQLLVGIVAVFAVLGIAVYLEYLRERKRLEDLATWAAGMRFTIEGGSRDASAAGLPLELLALPLFNRGRARKVRNLIRGRDQDGATLVMDYRYTTQSGKNSATFEQTVAAFELPAAALPSFELRPEGLFARIGQLFGSPDIDFESNPEFSRRYQLTGADQEAVRRLFERHAVGYLAGQEGWGVEGAGAWLIAYRPQRRQKPEDYTTFLGQARMIMRAVVPY
jgi:hypothetical protein